jgi:hypothetical protein
MLSPPPRFAVSGKRGQGPEPMCRGSVSKTLRAGGAFLRKSRKTTPDPDRSAQRSAPEPVPASLMWLTRTRASESGKGSPGMHFSGICGGRRNRKWSGAVARCAAEGSPQSTTAATAFCARSGSETSSTHPCYIRSSLLFPGKLPDPHSPVAPFPPGAG